MLLYLLDEVRAVQWVGAPGVPNRCCVSERRPGCKAL
jgi:hypothetical protein